MTIAVFYYSQSGQALEVAKAICRQLDNDRNTVVYKPLVSEVAYPFPWSADRFFDIFPETRLGLPPIGIEPLTFDDIADADLVMVVGQSWFLSPSVPLQAFFTNPEVMDYLNGRDVVFVNVCRNMWLMTLRRIKEYLSQANANLIGHVVLQDRAQNLVSVVTIIRWLMYGKKEKTRLLPPAGVSVRDINEAERFGAIIETAPREQLQSQLLAAGAIDYKPSVIFLEKMGHRMFGFWAKFIRRKGEYGDPRRKTRVKLFAAYLVTVLFLISPFGQLFFWITYPFRRVAKNRKADCNLDVK